VNKEEIISSGLLELYVMGKTTAAENAMVETACAEFPEVKAEVIEIEIAMEKYACAHAHPVNESVKQKIFTSLNFTDPIAQKQSLTSNVVSINKYKYIAAASVALLLASTILNTVYFNKFKNAEAKFVEGQNQMAQINERMTTEKNEMSIVRSKYSLPLKLKPDVAPKDADAKIYWITNTGEIYIDPSNLPAAPKGMQYQLWAIVGGKAIDGGLINTDADNHFHIQKMKTFGKAEAFAVTLEKEGGVIASKEKPYVIVSL
jgi:anti-sigma-K factor RskA